MEPNRPLEDLVAFFQHSLNAILLGTLVVDADGKPIDYVFDVVNPSFEKMTGLKGSDILGLSARTVSPAHENIWIEKFGQVILTGEAVQFEAYAKRPDKWYEVSAFRYKPMGFISTFMDVTERVKAVQAIHDLNRSLEDKLEQRTADLEKTFRDLIESERFAVVGQLAAGVAHELNTPLGAISSANGLISRFLVEDVYDLLEFWADLDADDRKAARGLILRTRAILAQRPEPPDRRGRQAFQAQAADAGVTVDQDMAEYLLELKATGDDFSRLAKSPGLRAVLGHLQMAKVAYRMSQVITDGGQQGEYVVNALQKYFRGSAANESTEFDVAEQLDAIVVLFHHRLKRGIEVVRNYSAGVKFHGHRQRLNQVWMNLINNAIQAMGDTGTLTLSATNDMASVTVSVADTGPGVPDAIREQIFEPYFTTKKQGEGIGLGLSLCREILNDHHGALSLETSPGRTVFTVHLPLQSES